MAAKDRGIGAGASAAVGDAGLIASLRAAVEAAPSDIPLRLHLAQLLLTDGARNEAVQHAVAVLDRDPGNREALELIRKSAGAAPIDTRPRDLGSERDPADTAAAELEALESQLQDVIPPRFVDSPAMTDAGPEVERSTIRFADVGGMDEAKARIDAAVLAPIRNPELGRLFKATARGGLLLYGPPGCGKTYLARAVAGELNAGFISVSLADILDSFIGQSERNVHRLFAAARDRAPCVVFLDEIDGLAQRRGRLRGAAWLRGTVNQLLTEMDGLGDSNDGVFVLAATNHPWDVDVALRRPGRLDRMVFVAPPDRGARAAIIRANLAELPVESIDVDRLADASEGYSGADLAYACRSAAEQALMASARAGEPRMIGMDEMRRALKDVHPSIGPWFDTARNVAEFANEGGIYDELRDYLKQRRIR